MKKIDVNYELYKIKSKSIFTKKKSTGFLVISSFLIFFGMIALFGVSFSNRIIESKQYSINIDIINGYEDKYYKLVNGGSFRDVIFSPNKNIKSLKCESGYLLYDSDSFEIYSDSVSEDINCVLEFEFNIPESLDISKLDKISDNFGISYVFNNNSNNYILFNDMLFRIIRINGDGSLRIMLNDSIGKFNNNEVDIVLNNWLNGLVNKEHVIFGIFDNYDLNTFDQSLLSLDKYFIGQVGLLSVNELLLYGIDFDNTMLSNKYYEKYWALMNYNIQAIDSNSLLDVRPIINIEVASLEGEGTMELPYKIIK